MSSGEGTGQPVAHRVDWNGNRRVNSILHIASVTQQRELLVTRAFIDRKIGEGKTRRMARRSHKRQLANRVIRRMWKDHQRLNVDHLSCSPPPSRPATPGSPPTNPSADFLLRHACIGARKKGRYRNACYYSFGFRTIRSASQYPLRPQIRSPYLHSVQPRRCRPNLLGGLHSLPDCIERRDKRADAYSRHISEII
jgi:hypothetical protein